MNIFSYDLHAWQGAESGEDCARITFDFLGRWWSNAYRLEDSMTAAVFLLFSSLFGGRRPEDEWKNRRVDAEDYFKKDLEEHVRERPGQFALYTPEGRRMICAADYRYPWGGAMQSGDKAWGYHVFRIPKRMPRN